jgi:hypothetical protein
VALEVGFSETTAKPERDIAWWINTSKGDVKMGLTIDIKRRSGSIRARFCVDNRTSIAGFGRACLGCDRRSSSDQGKKEQYFVTLMITNRFAAFKGNGKEKIVKQQPS